MRFLSEDFLLTNPVAKKLYHEFAAPMPIYDYHCHIDPKDIYEDKRFTNIYDVWLSGDHYKWRIMRSCGVEETYITGNAPTREKFQKFAEALPRCVGNPMYHWCHLELKNYFGYEGTLNGDTAEEVWNLTLEALKDPAFSARGLIQRSNVAMVGTTDDPTSDLRWHKLLRESGFSVRVLPSFRPDNILNLHKAGFGTYMQSLAEASGMPLTSVEQVKGALTKRIAYFKEAGSCCADHGLDYVMYRPMEDGEVEVAYQKALRGEPVSDREREGYQTALLLHCAKEYKKQGLVMQLHFSCMRNPNTRAYASLGPDTGFDCMAVTDSCKNLYDLMDALEREGGVPRTILYSLNPKDDEWIDTLIGAFQSSEIPGKIQHGSAWWFNDNKVGMQNQMTSLANLGVLGNFVGMLTDSRSLLSYARHEYFRRILCNLIGTWVKNGEYPEDYTVLGGLIQDICANNAKRYFGL